MFTEIVLPVIMLILTAIIIAGIRFVILRRREVMNDVWRRKLEVDAQERVEDMKRAFGA